MAEDDPIGVPGGGELVRVDGAHYYMRYQVPGANQWMYWHVNTVDRLKSLGGGSIPEPEHDITRDHFNNSGVNFGSIARIDNTAEHPFETFLSDVREEAQTSPWLRDPEVVQHVARSVVEGRPFDETALERTEWWQSRTEGERAWARLRLSDPETAEQNLASARVRVRDALIQSGYQGNTDGIADYYARQYAGGQLTDAQLQDSIRRETDPYAPGASPFAGRNLGEDDQVWTDGEEHWIERDGQRYRLTGPGQIARYANDAMQAAPAATYYTHGGDHYLQSGGKWYRANGLGQVRQAERLFGEAREAQPENIGEVEGNFIDLFGGRMESFEVGSSGGGFAGDARELFAGEGPPDTTGLAGEEEVHRMVQEWLGPMFANGFDEEWIAEWAGRIRNNENERESLVEHLRNQRLAMFPEYSNPELRYTDIAAPWKSMWSQVWGEQPDETDALFNRVVQMNDMQEAQNLLRREGLRRGNGQVTQGVLTDLGSAMGPGVLGGA